MERLVFGLVWRGVKLGRGEIDGGIDPQVDLTFPSELGVGGEWGTQIPLSHRADDPIHANH